MTVSKKVRFVLRDRRQWVLIAPREVPAELAIRAIQTMLPTLHSVATDGHQKLAVEWLGLKVQHALTMQSLSKEGISEQEAASILANEPSYIAYQELSKLYTLTQARA